MRRALVLLAALGAAAGCGDQPTLVVYSPHGVEMLGEFQKLYEAKYPGAKVDWQDLGSETCLQRLQNERGRPLADVWWGGPVELFDAALADGLLEPYRPTWVDQVDARHRHPQDLWTVTFETYEAIVYNAKLLKREEAPQHWDDLLDERWKGKVVIRAPLASGTMRTIFAAMIARQVKLAGSEAAGFEWLRKLHRNTKAYAVDPNQLNQMLARGEGVVTLWNLTDAVLQRTRYGYAFDFVLPDEGQPVVPEGIAIVKGAPHAEEARRFYEFVTSKEALLLQARDFFRIPVRRDLASEEKPEWLRGLKLVPLDVDQELVRKKTREWMTEWDRSVKGG
jgi:iron(III) transport system substrate-binding protein